MTFIDRLEFTRAWNDRALASAPAAARWRVVHAHSGRILGFWLNESQATMYATQHSDATYVEHRFAQGWGTWTRVERGVASVRPDGFAGLAEAA